MSNEKDQISKPYDLEERTFNFTKLVIEFVNKLPENTANIEIGKQVIRSAGSVGANYIEANESLSKKDFVMRIRYVVRNQKRVVILLRLIQCNDGAAGEQKKLVQESQELMKIFGAILVKTDTKS